MTIGSGVKTKWGAPQFQGLQWSDFKLCTLHRH